MDDLRWTPYAESSHSVRDGLCLPTHTRTPPSGGCPPHTPPSSVVVIGALSFLGSRVAADLRAKGLTVYALADMEGTEGALPWYRKEQLWHMGVTVEIIDFSNVTQVEGKIANLLTEDGATSVVYVPTLAVDKERSGFNSERISQETEKFVTLLEAMRNISPCTRTLLISDLTPPMALSHDHHMLVQTTWVETFELMLSAYHNLYALPFTLFRVGGVYGPWGEAALSLHTPSQDEGTQQLHLCWYVTDVTDLLYKALNTISRDCEVLDLGSCKVQDVDIREDGLTKLNSMEYVETEESLYTWRVLKVQKESLYSVDSGIKTTLSWARAFTSSLASTKRNVIFTSYFTSEMDAQRNRHKNPDRFSYLSDWYNSVVRLSMEAVIFHDGLKTEFQHRLSQHHPGVSFKYVPSLKGRSTNDARFYAYLDYLQEHSDIHKVILTDISDVQFQMDPFDLMELLGDWLYIGTDIDIFPTMQTMPWIHERLRDCFGNYSVDHGVLHTLMQMDTVYNAGVIGGTRETVLSVLSRIVGYLDTTPAHLNCNMPAVNVAVHKHFFDNVFTGFPLTSRFLRKQVSPKGVYIIHK